MAPWQRILIACILPVVIIRLARMIRFQRWMGLTLVFRRAADHPRMFAFVVGVHVAVIVALVALLFRA